ncbi:MFS transporter [Brevibacillus sp. TJ4]|uniref:MFS transporter n=1 Tax=Brevibacillus sp. TJ4 TaxID=3234853 RepID=UPI0037CE38D6
MAVLPQVGEKLIRVLAFTLVLSSMSAMMFNIVLPKISVDFALSYSQVSWVTSSYILVYAIGSVIYGKLADSYKLKNLITFGLCLFMVGSLVGLSAQTFWMVLAGRSLQAAGASVIPATAMLIPVRYFPPESRGRALGISATGLAVGNALGPVVSALLVSLVDWRWLFCVPLLILFTLPLYRKYLGDERGEGRAIDWWGAFLLAGTVAFLMLSVTNGTWLLLVGGALCAGCFFLRIRTASEPFVSLQLFENKRYTLGLSLSVLAVGIGYALPFLTPLLLADVNRLESGLIGFAMVPAAVVSAILGRRGGRLADSKGNRFLFSVAVGLLVFCFALFSIYSGVSAGWIAVFLIFGTVGQMFMQISLNNAISRTLPKEQTGVGMGLLTMLTFLSGAVVTGIYSRVAEGDAATAWNPLHMYPEASVYSNLYLVLALLQIGLLLLYRLRFDRQAVPDKHTV